MATGNEILSYTGDKNLAFGSTALPAVSTDVVVDLTPGIKFWQDYANNKLLVAREREAQLARKRLLAQKDLQEKIDIGQYEILPQDKERFKIIWDEFRNDLKKGAAGGYLSGDPTNEDFNKIQDHIDRLEQFSKFSMQQKEDAKILKTQIAQDPNKYENAGDIETWLNIGDPFKRSESLVELKAKFEGFNAIPYRKALIERLENDNINLKGEADRFNNVTYTVEGDLNIEGIKEDANATYDNDPNAQELAIHLISKAPEYYGADPKAAFQKWSLDLAPESLQPIIRGINYSPYQRAAAAQDVKSQDAWVVDFGTDLYSEGSSAYTRTKSIAGTDYQYAPAQTDMYIQAPTKLFGGGTTDVTLVGGFIRDPNTGKLYAETVNEPDKKFPIENYNTQVITPTLAMKYKGSPNYGFSQDIQNYAPIGDPENLLKIPRSRGHGESQPQTNQQPKQKTYKGLDAQGNPIFE